MLIFAAGLGLGTAGTAQAQSPCDLASVTPNQGPPGTPVIIYVQGVLAGAEEAGLDSQAVTVLWDGILVASIPPGGLGDYSGSFNVPGDAVAGAHTVTVNVVPPEGSPQACPFTFTVTATVQQQAYTEAAAGSKPITGFPAAVPIAGLLAGAGGWLLLRKRPR